MPLGTRTWGGQDRGEGRALFIASHQGYVIVMGFTTAGVNLELKVASAWFPPAEPQCLPVPALLEAGPCVQTTPKGRQLKCPFLQARGSWDFWICVESTSVTDKHLGGGYFEAANILFLCADQGQHAPPALVCCGYYCGDRTYFFSPNGLLALYLTFKYLDKWFMGL